ncbi:helix-turn-helix transcriptional regulator [Megamonas funiformis]|uniref:helix-turn-helix domain-containing protein n=1 Tax=Megamonas funiformis TaxID=437897 RepID=UPI002942ACE5|nr:helix-turn-helix transcriptional regulator [Megamonas funiformis]
MTNKSNKEIFSNNLRLFMKQKNKSRKEICDDLNIKYTTFADWYNGNKYPRIDKIELLAKYFNIQKSDLIENKDDINKNLTELTEKSNETIPQIRAIQRAMTNVDEEKRNRMLEVLKISFQEAFEEDDDD